MNVDRPHAGIIERLLEIFRKAFLDFLAIHNLVLLE